MYIINVLLGKVVIAVLKSVFKRNASTWPGHVALKADKAFIKKILAKNPHLKIILIAGTNGKTTTTKALTHILNENSISSITNNAGANLLNGLASTLVLKSDLLGKIKENALIFEVDENSFPLVLEDVPNPDAIILLNLFRDQLDRYGEVNTIAEKWKSSLEKLTDKTLVVANADDPLIAYVANATKNKAFFTIDDKFKTEKTLSHAVDSTTCPNCSSPLIYSEIAYSHLGNYKCTNCDFKSPKAKTFDIKTGMLGTYNLYNLTSAVLTSEKIFGIPFDKAIESLQTFKAAFGRQEVVEADGKKVMLLLSKNPTGFNESIKVVLENRSLCLLILLNDRIPDGRDVSWIWDVDFEVLNDKKIKVFVSGDRPYDMANRLDFAGIPNIKVFENIEKAYKGALAETRDGKTLTVLPTYSAMLEIRKLISGKPIL